MKNNKKTGRVLETIKALFSYIGAVGMALVVMWLWNGAAGILIAATLIIAFVLSLAETLIVKRFVEVDISIDKPIVSKGYQLNCIVRMSKTTFLPVPVIEVSIDCSAHLKKELDTYRLSLLGGETNSVSLPLTAVHSGAAEITAGDVFICDYLGIFRFRLKKHEPIEPMRASVYPNIPDAPVQTDFLKTAVLFSTDDEEEETDETSLTQTGQPGYDHREYFPGDPIKRINWKLSSKRDIYMIRLDEKVAGAGQSFFLDLPLLEETDDTLLLRDHIIEGALAVMTMLVREGREAAVYVADRSVWVKHEIRSQSDVYQLQEMLASFTPSDTAHAVPPEITASGKTPICFTAASAEYPQSADRIVSECPNAVLICSLLSQLPVISPEQWIMNSDFELAQQR